MKGFSGLHPNCYTILMSLAGKRLSCEKAGVWWASVPPEKRPADSNKEFYDWLTDIWDETYGDRRNELVFIGTNFNEAALLAKLEEAQLQPHEIADTAQWKSLFDPFPHWEKIKDLTDQFEVAMKQRDQPAGIETVSGI